MPIPTVGGWLSSVTHRAFRLVGLAAFSRIAIFALTAVLVCSTVFALESASATTRTSHLAAVADDVNESFRAARYALASEESANREYRLEPGKAVAAAHRSSADSFVSSMQQVHALGDSTDRTIADDVLRAHKLYLIGTSKMYAAVDRHETGRALALDHLAVDPLYARIDVSIKQRADTHEALAEAALSRLSEAQRQIVSTTVLLSALGLLSLGIFLVVLLTYQRRLTTTHQAKVDKLESEALNDNLTGIGNHRAYQEDLAREVSRAHRYGETLALALLDIDDFKVVNDRNGHLHGDSVLIKLAALFSSLKAEDRAYRIGGDEFAVILPHTSNNTVAEAMQRLRADVQSHLFGCTVSIGLACLTGVECSAVTLQAQAEAAIYAGKRAGRNRVTTFDASLDRMLLLSPSKIHNLHQLIAAGSMSVVFQPIWDVQESRVLSYEALSRPDSKYGFNGPQEAFELAERIGCAHELDEVCRLAALASAGDLPSDALLFINVSPQSLDHGRLDTNELVKAVRAAGLTPERVVIEITERSITRVDAVINSLRELQQQGFRLALDDTGAGNSGLEMLSRLPLEFVKIDRALIVKALSDKNARGVMAGIVAIAETTGAYVIAEGIEDTEMLHFVCNIGTRQEGSPSGVHGVQGYLLRRPSQAFLKREDTKDIQALLTEFAVAEQPSAKSRAAVSAP
jgi:diguanylate cyclase (GGDEF)-like protein